MGTTNELLERTRKGFSKLSIDISYQTQALLNLEEWLTKKEFIDYFPQIQYIIESKDWDYLLDCFYQIIPFGTGGRRGEVGIGPNRINKWTIQASAQGHSQYLIASHGESVKSKGVVLSYGIREFFTNKHFDDNINNPVSNLKGVDLAWAAAEVYAANGIKSYLFEGPRTTPELSFAIRHLGAIAGDMFDASHNPPEHNGKKVYDETGGQLIPPYDEELVNEVTKNVKRILTLPLDEGKKENLIQIIGKEVDEAYISQVVKLSLSTERDIDIVYTPLHGLGSTSILDSLNRLGFKVHPDPATSNQSGRFENITFNIPNPEVQESFDTTLVYAKKLNADLILNSDPDADRIGVMVKHEGNWKYINGNEIGAILVNYVIQKKKESLKNKGVVIKTSVTTNLATKISNENKVTIIGELPVGFKYIGDEMNKLEKRGEIDNFLIGLEESHGYIAGNYLRDKDATIPSIWLSELAAELKKTSETLVDYLNKTYSSYGYFRNYLTEIRLPGAEGMTQIKQIQDTLRKQKPKKFGKFEVDKIEDFWDRKPIVSETDKVSKDLLVFHFKKSSSFESMKVTVRPSGTEPKIKMYFEIGNKPCDIKILFKVKEETELMLQELEKTFMTYSYKIIGIDFPERGHLLFWQMPLKDKMHYFEIEPMIESLVKEKDTETRRRKLMEYLDFLGSNPMEKVDKAFKEKHYKPIKEYLSL